MFSKLQRSTPIWLTWFVVFGWMGLIFFLSSQSSLPVLPESWLDLLIKKLAHATAYGILFVLWCNALRTTPLKTQWLVLFALTLTFGYAISDEYHQTFVPGRHGQALDVLIDTTGALAVFVAVNWKQKRSLQNSASVWRRRVDQ